MNRVPIKSVTGSGTVEIELSYCELVNVSPSGNITLNLTNIIPWRSYALRMKQGATPYTIAFSQTIKWKGGTAYTATNSANAIDIVSIFSDGTDLFGTFGDDYS